MVVILDNMHGILCYLGARSIYKCFILVVPALFMHQILTNAAGLRCGEPWTW